MNTLSIVDWKQTGLDLHKEIIQAVRDSQKLILRPHYDELLCTQSQFDDLLKLKAGMLESYLKDFYMYNTGMSVMEVRVA